MTPLIAGLNRLGHRWAEVAWAVSWQAVLVAAVAAGVARLMRPSPPALRYWLWQIAAAKLLLMPLWGASIPLPATVGHGLGLQQEEAAVRKPNLSSEDQRGDRLPRFGEPPLSDGRPNAPRGPVGESLGWRTWIFLGWGSAVMLQVAAILHQRRRLSRVLDRTVAIEDPALQALAEDLSKRIGLSTPPRLRFTDDVGSPFVCDPLRPTLVLPRDLVSTLPPESLKAVLLHELSHIKRRDLVWDWIPTIARVLYTFHPAGRYIALQARLERELACDQAAMVITGQGAGGYASMLVDVVSRSSGPSFARSTATPTDRDGLMVHDSLPS